MNAKDWAYLSNDLVYSSMAVFTLAFLAHAFQTAWSLRNPEAAENSTGNLLTKTLDYTKTEKLLELQLRL